MATMAIILRIWFKDMKNVSRLGYFMRIFMISNFHRIADCMNVTANEWLLQYWNDIYVFSHFFST